MKIDDAFLEEAVLNIYATCVFGRSDHAMDAGATLDFVSLREEWGAYHLRRGDLDRALDTLVNNGELTRDSAGELAIYAITEKGLRIGTEGREQSLQARWQAAKDVAKLTWAQNRPGHGHPDALQQRRRSGDLAKNLSE